MDRCMVCAKAVLIVAVVDGNLDRHRRINQPDNGSGDADVVCVASICCTGKSVGSWLASMPHGGTLMQDSGQHVVSRAHLQRSSPTQQRQSRGHHPRPIPAPISVSARLTNRATHTTYFSEDAKLVHGIDDAEERVYRLGFLANHGLVHVQFDLVVCEISLHLLAVDVEDVHVHYGQTSSPSAVAVGELVVLDVKYAVHEREVILDLLVTLDVKAARCFGHGGFEVRHDGQKNGE